MAPPCDGARSPADASARALACWSPNGDRVTLEKPSEELLTTWMRQGLSVTWTPYPDPKSVERALIERMKPPLDVDHNGTHRGCAG